MPCRLGGGARPFVREMAGLRSGPGDASGIAWQSYVLPPTRESPAGRMIDDLSRQAFGDELIALSAGYPTPELYPIAELEAATRAVHEKDGPDAFGYGPVEGSSDLRNEFAELGANEVCMTTPTATSGARQALTLATRADVRPVPVDESGLNVDAVEQLLRRHEIRLLVLQSRLQNPTGRDLI